MAHFAASSKAVQSWWHDRVAVNMHGLRTDCRLVVAQHGSAHGGTAWQCPAVIDEQMRCLCLRLTHSLPSGSVKSRCGMRSTPSDGLAILKASSTTARTYGKRSMSSAEGACMHAWVDSG